MNKLIQTLSILVVLFLTAMLSLDTAASDDLNLEAQIPLDPNVIHGKLDNGLTYYILKNQKPEKRTEFRLAVNIGSLAENEEQQGLAHFVEHMAFNGTKNFARSELIDYLEMLGVKFGAHLNAYTSFDETVYMLQLPTDDEEVLDKGLQVLEDWAHNISFDPEEIEKERGVVIEEWRTRLGGETRMFYDFLPVLYKDSRYPERLPIGKKEIIESFDHETLISFYKKWYRPDLMALIAVGDFDVKEMEKKIIEQFSRIPKTDNAVERDYYPIPDHKEILAKVTTDPEAMFSRIQVYYKNAKHQYNSVDDYRTILVQDLYKSILAERLEELKSHANPPFNWTGSSVRHLTRTKDSYSAWAFVNEDGIARGLENLLNETERIKQHGFYSSELERNTAKLMRQMEKEYEERDKTESRNLARGLVNHYLRNTSYPGFEWENKMHETLLPTIRLEDVNGIVDKWVRDENIVIIATAPEKEGVAIPDEQELLDIFHRVSNTSFDPPEITEIPAILMTTLPESGSIESEKAIEEVGVTELILSNGIKVVLKSTDFKNDEIQFLSFSHGGASHYEDSEYFSALMSAMGVSASGLADISKPDLSKMLADKVARLSPFVYNYKEGFRGSCSSRDLETFFQMLHLQFANPRFDEEAFNSFVQREKMTYSNMSSNPDYYFGDKVSKILTGNNMRSGWLWMDEEFDQVNYEDATRIYAERFMNPADFTFFFVGSLNENEIKPLLEKYLASLQTKQDRETFKDLGVEYIKGGYSENIYKGTEPKSWVSINFISDYDYTLENNHAVSSLVSLLNITLREELREDQGGVYGVRIRPRMNNYPKDELAVTIQFSCDPEKVEELIGSVKKEVEKVRKGEIDEDDVVKVKEKARRERETDLKNNRFWIYALNNAYYDGMDIEKKVLDEEERIDAVNVQLLQNTATKYLQDKNLVKVVLYPESMKAR